MTQTFSYTVIHSPLPAAKARPQQQGGKAAIDGGVELHGKEMLVYVFSGLPVTMCTCRMIKKAMREKLNLYRTAGGFLYWAQHEESLDDLFICHPEAFYLRQGSKMIELKKAADSDYFILHEAL